MPSFLTKRVLLLAALAMITLGMAVINHVGYDRIARKITSRTQQPITEWVDGEKSFPVIDSDQLSDTRKKIILLAEQEFVAQSEGIKYSEGTSEAWCANFVSWVMKEAGMPLNNPHSGGWRIPGTFTLYDYYVAEGRFRQADSGYEPTPGDVAIYRNSPIFGDHANIVLSFDNDILTTVGGNEGNRVRVFKNVEKQYEGLLGYGVLH